MNIPSIENYEKLKSPNAQYLALRKAKEFIDMKINELQNDTISCAHCGFLIYKKDITKSIMECSCCSHPIDTGKEEK